MSPEGQAREAIRATFVDSLSEAISITLQAGIKPEEIRADIDDCLSIILPEPEPATCQGCSWPEHTTLEACTGLTADDMREAVSTVMADGDEFWTIRDTEALLVTRSGEWSSPGTFGSTYGTVKRVETAGLDDVYAIVNVQADEPGDSERAIIVRVAQ